MRAIFLILLLSSCASKVEIPVPIEVHGHRGARMVRPENTLPAFSYALREGVDVIELDLAVTKDNQIIVSHDPYINRTICSGLSKLPAKTALRTLDLKTIKKLSCGSKINPNFPKQKTFSRTRIPTLEEVFKLVLNSKDLAAKKVQFNIETKVFPAEPELTPSHEEFAKLVNMIIIKHGMSKRVILQSFDHRTLVAIKKINPEIRTAYLTYANYFNFEDALTAIGIDYLSPYHKWIDKEAVTKLHAAGIKVVPWTANDKIVWEKLVKMNVDGIISDDPKALIAYLKSRGLR